MLTTWLIRVALLSFKTHTLWQSLSHSPFYVDELIEMNLRVEYMPFSQHKYISTGEDAGGNDVVVSLATRTLPFD